MPRSGAVDGISARWLTAMFWVSTRSSACRTTLLWSLSVSGAPQAWCRSIWDRTSISWVKLWVEWCPVRHVGMATVNDTLSSDTPKVRAMLLPTGYLESCEMTRVTCLYDHYFPVFDCKCCLHLQLWQLYFVFVVLVQFSLYFVWFV